MKHIFYLLISIVAFNFNYAQQRAVTENGDEVLLFEDGTWRYSDPSIEIEETEISINNKQFKKDETSTFLVKSKNINVGFWINPKKWSFEKASNNDDAEFEFNLKNEDLYGLVITEKISIPVETLANIAIGNIKELATDFNVINKEYRNVNGIDLIMAKIDCKIQSINFTYTTYFYSTDKGSVQFFVYTSTQLSHNYKDEIEAFLNGLVEL